MTSPHSRGRRVSAPVCFISAVPEIRCRPIRRTPDRSIQIAVGVWATYSRRQGDRWSRETPPVLMTCRKFWRWVEDQCAAGRLLWIVSPSACDLLTLTGFWRLIDPGPFRVIDRPAADPGEGESALSHRKCWMGQLVMRPKTQIVSARCRGGSIRCVSLSNYCDTPLAQLVDSVVPHDVQLAHRYTPSTSCIVPSILQSLALSRWFRTVVSGWIRESYGTFGTTAGNLSLSVWRSTDGKGVVKRHRDEEGIQLESYAAFGGRAMANFHGVVGMPADLPEPGSLPQGAYQYPPMHRQIYRYDIRSMYPFLLGHHVFPTQLCGVIYDVPLSDLHGILKYWGAIATVRICTREPEYPVRIRDNTGYPVGSYVTALAGPELHRCLLDGCILQVYALARYKMGRPFQGWSATVLRERMAARERQDPCAELLWKTIANAFSGKFAQRSTRWIPRPGRVPPADWGEWWSCDTDGKRGQKHRAVAGVWHDALEGKPGHRLPAAVYCYLTSYGRLAMRQLREAIGTREWLSQDTDGLYSTSDPDRVSSMIGSSYGTEPGRLRLVGRSKYAWWITPKHYVCDGRWTLSGYCDGFEIDPRGRVHERRTVNPALGGHRGVPDRLIELVRTLDLPSLRPDTPVGPDGWAKPVVIGPRSLVVDPPVPFAPPTLFDQT